MKKLFWVVLAACMATTCLCAQEITKVGRATLSLGTASEDALGYYDEGSNIMFNICWFSFNYPSIGGDGQPVTLSALACMPSQGGEGAEINNVIAGCHVTITSNKDCPSEFNSSGELLSDVFLNMSLASSNLVPQGDLARHNLVILPDYEGYGITKDRVHPYLCSEITARQVTDALRHGIMLYQNDSKVESFRRPFRKDWRTICTGYSQGGAVAMATQRYIEEQGMSDELHLAGSLCGDGPYSPIVTILNYMEQDRDGKEMSMPIVIPLMLKALCDYDKTMANHQIGDFVDERFLETGVLDLIASKEKSIDDITDFWKQLYKDGMKGDKGYFHAVLTRDGKAKLKNILKPELYDFLRELLDKNPDYSTSDIPLPEPGSLAGDLLHALEHSNLTKEWIPIHPVCLYHSTGDEVVPFENYLIAASNFGDQAMFYSPFFNSNHVNTGQEFFVSEQRLDCIRFLASTDNDGSGIASTAMPDASTQKWFDLHGRPVTGEPASKGIFITGGKKILIK